MIQQYQSQRPNVGIINAGLVEHYATFFDCVKINTPSGIRFQNEVEQAKLDFIFLSNHKHIDLNPRLCVMCNSSLTVGQQRFCSIGCVARYNVPFVQQRRAETRKKKEVVFYLCANPKCNNKFTKNKASIKKTSCCRSCGNVMAGITRRTRKALIDNKGL
jgi:hypothetical protein